MPCAAPRLGRGGRPASPGTDLLRADGQGGAAQALTQARQAAAGQDVGIGGGPSTIREFLAAGLIDYLHMVEVPIVLGRGQRLWDGLEALEDRFRLRP